MYRNRTDLARPAARQQGGGYPRTYRKKCRHSLAEVEEQETLQDILGERVCGSRKGYK